MEQLWIFLHAAVVALLLIQPLAIRTRFGRAAPSLIRRYAFCVGLIGLALLAPLVSEYFDANILRGWLGRSDSISRVEELYPLAPWKRAASFFVFLLPSVFSSAWLPAILPKTFLALLEYEGIPVSRRQAFFAKLTKWLSFACGGYTLTVNFSFLLQILTASSFMRDITFNFTAINVIWTACVFGSLLAWAVHAFQTKVFQASPFLKRTSKSAMAVTSACLVLLLFQETVRLLKAPLPKSLDFLAGRGAWYGLLGYWILGAAWGLGGLYILFKTAPGASYDSAPPPFRDPGAKPLPAGDALAAIFKSKGLSERESEAAALIVGGAGNKEIAELMGISYNTVKNHVASIFHKLGATNRFELIKQLRDS